MVTRSASKSRIKAREGSESVEPHSGKKRLSESEENWREIQLLFAQIAVLLNRAREVAARETKRSFDP